MIYFHAISYLPIFLSLPFSLYLSLSLPLSLPLSSVTFVFYAIILRHYKAQLTFMCACLIYTAQWHINKTYKNDFTAEQQDIFSHYRCLKKCVPQHSQTY